MAVRLAIALLAALSPQPRASEMPEDVSGQTWFEHCRQLSNQRLSNYPVVANYRVTYAWQSEIGYLWDWENGNHAGDSAHYCVRLALYDKRGQPFEGVTLLCSVTGRGKTTETWMFGNREIADRLCPMTSDGLKAMDSRAPRRLPYMHK